MNIKQFITVGIAGVAMGAMALDNVEVTDVKARQRYPWNGKVDIDFTLDSKPTEPYQMQVEVYDNVGKTNLPVKSVCTEGISFEENPTMVREDTRRIIWDAAKDLPNGFKCTNVLVTCRDSRVNAESNRYMIVDLSAGASATTYPVTYTNRPPAGGWTEEYMKTKIALRRISPGVFMMGSKASDSERSSNESYHEVFLTKAYYVSIYELTVAQYEMIMGGDGEDLHPVELRWQDVRGWDVDVNPETKLVEEYGGIHYKSQMHGVRNNYAWPYSSEVAPDSLMGRLRSRSKVKFDLPTEAQWERACRAGTSTPLYVGGTNCAENAERMQSVARLDITGMRWMYVGQSSPNAFGIYDMGGSIKEWCLDAYAENLGEIPLVDPVGLSGAEAFFQRQYSDNGADYAIVEGFERVIKGDGVRSSARSFGLVLNCEKVPFMNKVKATANTLCGVRLCVTVDE